MANRHWSTQAIAPGEQFAFWREAVCEAVLNVATEHPGEGFFGDIACAQYGHLRFAAFRSARHEIRRLKSHIGRSGDAHYLVSLQRRGACRMIQDDGACELQSGDLGVVDGTRPFRVEFPEAVDRIVAVIPHEQLHSRAPWLGRRPLRRIAASSPLSRALTFYLERLSGPDCASAVEAAVLSDNICNLVALMTAGSDGQRAVTVQPGLDEIILTLRQHLADPELSPRMLAARLRMSVRTVHKRFEEADTTFGQWVLDHRLAACRRALEDPRQSPVTISEIAFGWGFNDLSHFSKAFKARFGLSPAQYRRQQRHIRDH